MRIGAAVAAGLAVVLVALVVTLSDAEPRQAGSNYVPEYAQVVTLRGDDSHCQRNEVVPDGAAQLRLLIGTYGRPVPDLEVTLAQGKRRLATGRLAGWSEGHVVVPVAPSVDGLTENVTVCISTPDAAAGSRTVLYGTLGRVRFEWLRAGRESWFAFLPTAAERFGLGKPFVSGSWVILAAAVLLALAWGVALRLAVRELKA